MIELLAAKLADGIAALVAVTAMFVGMRLFYGAWPWESRKTWYHTKTFVPMTSPPDSEAKEIMADTDSDHFDRKLITADYSFSPPKTLRRELASPRDHSGS